MSKKTIIFVSTLHRTSERFITVLEDLSKDFEILILNIGQASRNTNYDDAKRYLKKIEKFKIIDSVGIKNLSERNVGSNYISNIINLYASLNFEKIACVILDDSRGKNNEDFLYKLCKKFQIPVIGNIHGQQEINGVKNSVKFGYKKLFDKFFCFGKKEQLYLDNCGYSGVAIPSGIPENDKLLTYHKTNKHILVITNFLVGSSDHALYDKNVFNKFKLLELQKILQKPIVFKIKHRFESNIKNEIAALTLSIPTSLDYSIIINSENEHELISESCCVLSYGSTMAFKPIQLGIPTAIFKELGVVGNFEAYNGLFSIGEDYFSIFEDKDEERKKFLNFCLEGGESFSATRIYSSKIREIINE